LLQLKKKLKNWQSKLNTLENKAQGRTRDCRSGILLLKR